MRIASALLALLLTFPLTGWLLVPAISSGGGNAAQTTDACARICAMHGMPGMNGKACPMMTQNRRDQACSCQISRVPHILALGPVHAVAPEPPAERFAAGHAVIPLAALAASSPVAGFPGAIDHPPSGSC